MSAAVDAFAEAQAWARRHAQRVFPTKGKIPLTERGHHDATSDIAELEAMWPPGCSSYGVALGELVILDCDDGERALAAVEAEFGVLPKTWRCDAPKGPHLYFRAPRKLGRRVRFRPGVDLLGDGFVVGPGSVRPDGGTYRWSVSPDDCSLADLPAAFLKALEPEGPRKAADTTGEKFANGTRNQSLASLAGTMRRRGMTEAAIRAALHEENAARCVPPLEVDEVDKIAASVGRYTPGEEERREPVSEPKRATALPATFERLLEEAARPRVPLGIAEIDNVTTVVAGTVVVIQGPEGAGKTSLGQQILLGHARERGPGLMNSCEMSESEVAAKTISQAAEFTWAEALRGKVPEDIARHALDVPRFRILSEDCTTLEHLECEIAALGDEFPGETVMVLFDYLQIAPSEGRDERERIKNTMERIRKLAKRRQAVIIVLSQTSRQVGQALRRGELSGVQTSGAGAESAQIERAAYLVLTLGSMGPIENGEQVVDLSFGKNRFGEGDMVLPMVFNGRRGLYRATGPAVSAQKRREEKTTQTSGARQHAAQLAIVGHLNACTEPQSRTSVISELGLRKQDALEAMKALISGKQVVRVKGRKSGGAWPIWTPEKADAKGLEVVPLVVEDTL
jgi:replicative DNA helicase